MDADGWQSLPLQHTKCKTLEHFLSDCKHFSKHSTKVHNNIISAVLDQLLTLKPQGWEFLPETELCKLPQSIPFQWDSPEEERKEQQHRPNITAWPEHAADWIVLFLEFTRATNKPDNMDRAKAAKGSQYYAVVCAINNAADVPGTEDICACTLPFTFGTLGSVLEPEAHSHLEQLDIKKKHFNSILGACVRAAVLGLAAMSDARTAGGNTVLLPAYEWSIWYCDCCPLTGGTHDSRPKPMRFEGG
eukprot:2063963-Rhodomonas_salina.3